MSKMSKEQVEARIAYLDLEIANCPSWGAAVSAMNEERKALKRTLAAFAPAEQAEAEAHAAFERYMKAQEEYVALAAKARHLLERRTADQE